MWLMARRDRLAVAACALLLLACVGAARGDTVVDRPRKVCGSLDIRNTPDQLQRLQGCTVIEGSLIIVLMERTNASHFEHVSFPELREITGYLIFYRIKGLSSIGQLFPNLSVIRGMQLFRDHALIIFDMESLTTVGMESLTAIERGSVRIEHNDNLCFSNTINWEAIAPHGSNNRIKSNKDPRRCGTCPRADRSNTTSSKPLCPVDANGRELCWNENTCQKFCLTACGNRSCRADRSSCCHPSCLGGCDGPDAADCHVCRHFALWEDNKRKCVTSCPANTYEYHRRCISEYECWNLPPPLSSDNKEFRFDESPANHTKRYKTVNQTCVWNCPVGYVEEGEGKHSRCSRCPPEGCMHVCQAGKVDTLDNAERFRGCTYINGSLEINIRGGGNVMKELESCLGEVREISGFLKVMRSYALVSLNFFKKLKKIGGQAPNGTKKHSLYIFDNPNLEELWNWDIHGPIEIAEGKLYIHFNPKLCYSEILPLKNMTRDPSSKFDDMEVSKENNGDKAPCLRDKLNVTVGQLFTKGVLLKWNKYCLDDPRKLLGYSIYYTPAQTNITMFDRRDACSDSWSVLDVSSEDISANDTELVNNSPFTSICNSSHVEFKPLTDLAAYTRYAAYVKTYTTLQDNKGAQSPIIYFRTLPGEPSSPYISMVDHLDPNTVILKWDRPIFPNGSLITYRIKVSMDEYNSRQISELNYCKNPGEFTKRIALRDEESTTKEPDTVTGDVQDINCQCSKVSKPTTRFTSGREVEQHEAIEFENALQNMVYIKNPLKQKPRIKRSLDNLLVVLYSNHSKKFNMDSMINETTSDNFIKSLYVEVNANRTSFKLEHLRHYTWYTVSIYACREKHPNETQDMFENTQCSEKSTRVFRTWEIQNADMVTNLHAEVLPGNKSQPEVNVTWDAPKQPNGMVVAFDFKHWHVDNEVNTKALQSCITFEDYMNSSGGYLLRNIAPGNYSIRVSVVSMRGTGNYSAETYVFIPERSSEGGLDWIWGVVGGAVCAMIVLAGGVWYAKRGLLPAAEANKLFASVNPEYVSTVYVPDEWEVPRTNVELIRELGQGSFGMVYEGIAKNIIKGEAETHCAVKTVNEHATDRERIEFLNEASVMKAFDTFHVVRLLGVVSRGQPTYVVMELMAQGDLKTYLRSHRPDAEGSLAKGELPREPPKLQQIQQMAIEIADGMAYLSAKKFVHRDLAARNCMVAGDFTVKVGDFGMTRDIYETDYYRKGTKGLLPVRWMSPESLKDGVFSSNSDVWSYGVVLWEMATLAMQPYQGLSNEQVLRYVVDGGVMERPEHCPDRLYELMRACWAHRPSLRPSFMQLVAELAPLAAPYFRHRSFFHSPDGQELYKHQRIAADDDRSGAEVNVGAVATGSGSNLFGVSGRLASWVRELSSLRSRGSEDAAAEPLAPDARPILLKSVPGANGVLNYEDEPAAH